ncbi:MAG: hypothetical protein RBT34_11785 [Anaerolineaceae bacterium]|nr:hypothetical protein [Anaerolineaceae bacterium]
MMSKAVKITLIVLGVLVIGAGIVMGGFVFRYARFNTGNFGPGSMMSNNRWNNNAFGPGRIVDNGRWNDSIIPNCEREDFGPRSFGRMNGNRPYGSEDGCGFNQRRPGRMGSISSGMHGMGGLSSSGLVNQEPLTLTQAQDAVEAYIATLGNNDLELAEVMIFDNHAYAEIVEKSTGIGAMEVLVDPVSLKVVPEYGPNMMWNLKYGMMAQRGSMGRGMMGGYWDQDANPNASADMDLTPEQAVVSAQDYLDRTLPGTAVEDHADPFYGYYTLHVTRDGEVVGMLSVNGFSGDVFLHTWHGDFIEMSEAE